jgi:hypothetical protein
MKQEATMAIRDYFNNRGVRVVTCPETHDGAAVKIDALFAATWGGALRLSACSDWPERTGCDQACLTQIAASPNGCLLRSIVTSWYAGKSCVQCRRPIGPIDWHEAPPALRMPDGASHEWSDFAPQDLRRLFETSQPLCWYCNNVNELARLRPGYIVRRERPAEPPRPPLASNATY